MRIHAYIRLQECTTKDRKAFVPRRQSSHGIARGSIRYYAVEGETWISIRRTLKTFDVMGATQCNSRTVCAWTKDIGPGSGKLFILTDREIPGAAKHENVKVRPGDGLYGVDGAAPELTSFGVGAIEKTSGMPWQPTSLPKTFSSLVDGQE